MKNQQDNDDQKTSEEPSAKKGQSFGTWLRQQRVVREIELREIAETSKISIRYLRALEEDRFEILPAPVFAKGFLRQYAKYVGLDPEEVVNFFISALEETRQEDTPTHPRRKAESRSFWTYLGLFFLLAALMLGAVWLVSYLKQTSFSSTEPGTNTPSAAAISETAADPAPDVSTPAREDGAATPPETVPPANAEEALGGDEAPADPEPEAVDPSESAAEPVAASSEAPLVLTLDFSGDCWIEVVADGQRRLAEMRVQGESLQILAEREVEMKIGDISVVEIEVNGRPYEVAGNAEAGVKRVRIDLETLGTF